MASKNYLDRGKNLQPFYQLDEGAGESPWTRCGVRSADGTPVVIRVLPDLGGERHLHRLERYLRPLVRAEEVLEVRAQQGDLFAIWRRVGDLDLKQLHQAELDEAAKARARDLALRALAQWHRQGMHHGPFCAAGVRFDSDIEHCWLVAPALERVAKGLPLPSRAVDNRALELELERWLPSAPSSTHLTPGATRVRRFAPPGHAREMRALLEWSTARGARNATIRGPAGAGKTTLARCFADALAEDRIAGIVVRPVDAPDLRWVGDILDRLADEVLALPPLVSRRAIGHSKSTVGMLGPIAAHLSPRWAELWRLPTPDPGQQFASADIEHSRLQAATALLTACSAHLPLILVLDDADRAEREVAAFVRALRSAPADEVKVLASATKPLLLDAAVEVELGPLRGEAMVAFVADVLRVSADRARPVANDLQGALSGIPYDVRSALESAVERGWIDATAPRLSPEHVEALAKEQREPALVAASLRERQDLWPVFEVCAVVGGPRTAQELAVRAGTDVDTVASCLARAHGEGALEDHGGQFCLRWSVARAIRDSLDSARRARVHRDIADRLLAAAAPAVDVAAHLVAAWGEDDGNETDRATLVAAGRDLLASFRFATARPIVDLLRTLIERRAFRQPDVEARARLIVGGWLMYRSDHDGLETILEVPDGAGVECAARLHSKAVMLHALEGDYEAACRVGFAALGRIGIELRGGDGRLRTLVERVAGHWDAVSQLPRANALARVRQELLGALLPAAFVARPERFDAVVLELAERTLDEGLTLDSVRGLTTLAQLACVDLGDSDFGARLGRISLALAQRIPGHRYLPIVYSDLANFIMPWSGYLEESYEFNRKGRKAAEVMGESQYGGYIRMHDAFNRLALGDRLGPLARRIDRYHRECGHNQMARQAIAGIRDAMKAMTAQASPSAFVEAPSGSPEMVQCLHHLGHALAAMVHREDALLGQHSREAARALDSTHGWAIPTILTLYLRGIDAYRRGDHDELSRVRLQLQPYERKIDPVSPLAEHLRALELEADGNIQDALAMFQRAINTGVALDFPPMPAFASEDAALAAGRGGLADVSASFVRRAARYYHEWGLDWKARALGQSASTTAPRTTVAAFLRPDGDPEDIAVDVLSELMEEVRAGASADHCELLLYRQTRLQRVLTSDGDGRAAPLAAGTVDERHLGHAAVNSRRVQARESAVAVPLFHGSNALVVYLRGGNVGEQGATGAVKAVTAPLKIWMDVWSVQVETLDVQRITLSLVDALGSHGFLVGFDGRGRALSGDEFRLPPQVCEATRQAISTGELQRLELPWPPDREQSIARLTAVPCPELASVRPDVEPALWFAEDITEATLAERGAAAERELALFRKLAGGLAHDLSNKLVMMSVLASRGSEDPEFTRAAREAFNAGRRLLSRMIKLTTDSAVAPAPAPLDIRRQLEGSSSLYSWIMDAEISFVVDLPPEPVWVLAEAGAIDRIVLNLIINAKQALVHARGEIRLRLLQPENERVVLEISDTGQGIPSAIAERIFDAGVSGKRSTGVGLNVVRHEANAIGAEVEVDSRVGVGTTFRVCLQCVAAPGE